jgi:mannose-6-phosphate isomerase-like protein (cupin superfamily)
MRIVTPALGLTLVATFGLAFVSAQGPVNQLVWAPKVATLNDWTPPHKPHTKLGDVLNAHQGQTDWVQTIVNDDTLHADYISMGPGKKTPRRMNADTREWWVVQAGEIRFTIDGVEPFVASKGFLVQVPYRTMYTMETMGNEPSLRFEVNIARALKMYPMDEKPVPVPGYQFVAGRIAGRGSYDERNKPFLDFPALVASGGRGSSFVTDARAAANVILGRGIPPPDPSNKGHYHEESPEFWFILLGQIRYTIEGLQTFIAEQGDVVYVPKQRFHLASFAGDGMACRLAMNGYPDLAHVFEAQPSAGRGQ